MKTRFIALALLFVSAAHSNSFAGVIFNQAVNFNYSAIDGTLNDTIGVISINFGSQNPDNGRIAANGTDQNGNNVLDAGDTTNLVGHAFIDQLTTTTGDIDPLDLGQPSSFNMTGVLRNVTGIISGTSFGPVFGNLNNFNGGFIDLYLDQPFETAFTSGDLANSVDDILVATFEVIGGQTAFLFNGTAQTQVFGKLVYNNNGFLSTASGLDPTDPNSQLLIEIGSFDRVLAPTTTFANINNGTGGVNIGAGFNPAGPGGFDVISTVDGNAQFASVPEPTSMLCFAGLALAGIGFRRRVK